MIRKVLKIATFLDFLGIFVCWRFFPDYALLCFATFWLLIGINALNGGMRWTIQSKTAKIFFIAIFFLIAGVSYIFAYRDLQTFTAFQKDMPYNVDMQGYTTDIVVPSDILGSDSKYTVFVDASYSSGIFIAEKSKILLAMDGPNVHDTKVFLLPKSNKFRTVSSVRERSGFEFELALGTYHIALSMASSTNRILSATVLLRKFRF